MASLSNKSDDIPLAKRAGPYPRFGRRQIRYLSVLFTALLIAITLVIIRSFVFAPISVQPPLKGYTDLPSPDGRLLGHFPYSEVSSIDLITVYPGLKMHKDTYAALKSMRAAARADGVDLILLSGFRSHALQNQIFFEIKSDRNQTAIERARVSAPPGYSEHSTGYAIDLGDAIRRDTDLSIDFESTQAFLWLKSNAAKYHFILSFPAGNFQGVTYEPWHWRFEGTADALREFEQARRFNSMSGD